MDRDDREAQELAGLGELPVSKRRERDELYVVDRDRARPGPGGTFRLPPGVMLPSARDVFNQNVAFAAAQAAPALEGDNPYLVTTTFDALPINAQQFQFSAEVAPQLEPSGDPEVLQGTVTFTVPTGVNGILRGIRWAADTIINEEAFNVTLIVRGIVHRTYEAMRLGQALTDFFPVYALAGPEQTFILQFDIGSGAGPVGYSPSIRAFMTGQLILDTGRELQYEPANEKPEIGGRRARARESRPRR